MHEMHPLFSFVTELCVDKDLASHAVIYVIYCTEQYIKQSSVKETQTTIFVPNPKFIPAGYSGYFLPPKLPSQTKARH